MIRVPLAFLLVAFLVVTSSAVVAPDTVRADSWDVPSLSKLLLTGDEVTNTLGCCLAGSGDVKPSTGDPLSVGRAYASTDGDLLNINLFASPDASLPPADLRDFILSGGFTQDRVNAGFDNVQNFTTLGVVLNNDVLCTFSGDVQGKTYNANAVAFIKGNIVGLVIYSTQKADPDTTVVGLAYGAQLGKLP